MPAPSSEPVGLAASTTSSGFADGLGRRALAFDREEGTMLERLTIRPELAAFESMLRDRVDRVAGLEDERLARPRTIERDADAALVVVSEFVPGTRLSDLLETSADRGASPGVDAAFGFLLDLLPALCGLHAGAGFPHGTIAPCRIIVTPAGQVVLLDAIYGGALSHLRYSRRRLWTEFGVATPASTKAPRLDVEADIAQVVLAGVMLVLGRPMYVDEFPVALPRVLKEVVEIAQIRGSSAFASGFQTFLERALPIPNRRPYTSADDALIDLRGLAGELGAAACQRAFVDFIEQMEPTGAQPAPSHSFDAILADVDAFGRAAGVSAYGDDELEDLDEDADEAEVSLEALVEEPTYDLAGVTEVEIPGEDARYLDAAILEWSDKSATPKSEPLSPSPPILAPHVEPEPALRAPDPIVAAPSMPAPAAAPPPPAPAPPPPAPPFTSEVAPAIVQQAVDETPNTDAASPQAAAGEVTNEDEEDVEEHAPPNSVRWRRAKRARSARARKDKLRSAAEPAPLATQKPKKPEPAPAPPPELEPEAQPEPEPKKAAHGNWLVAPGRAAAFDPPVPDAPPIAPAPVAQRPLIPVPETATTPTALSVPPVPQYAPYSSPMPAAGSIASQPYSPPPPAPPAFSPPTAWTPTPVAPASIPPPPINFQKPAIAVQPAATLKLKEPAGRSRPARMAPPPTDIWATPTPPPAQQESTVFPWKLAAAALIVMAVVIVGGRSYLPAKDAGEDETYSSPPSASSTSASSTKPSSSSSAPKATVSLPAPNGDVGRLEIETQPAGAKVLLDGKPAGESPLAMDVPAGRHTVTLVSQSGSVKRTVRVEAGRTERIDVPIFSGWVGIFAPFVLEVSEGGKVIGTTEESRLMLSPGRHELTLTNKELEYKSVQSVNIEPGELRSITLEPRGSVNMNATPWAEVWIDGQKVGDTPIANMQLPLGIREVVFKHPQFGERRVSVTIKGNAPAVLSIDMAKP